MLKQTFVISALVILISLNVFSDQPVIKIDVLFDNTGNIEFSKPIVILGEPMSPENGDNLAILYSLSGDPIYQTNFTLVPGFRVIEDPEDIDVLTNSHSIGITGKRTLYLPLMQEASALQVSSQRLGTALPIMRMICNEDTVCNGNENVLGCPSDCSIANDKYCTPFEDGICDPDCFQGIDLDCDLIENPDDKEEEVGLDQYLLIVGGILLALIGLHFIRRRR